MGVECLEVRDNWDSSDDDVEGRVEAHDGGASTSELKEGSLDLEENSLKPVEISSKKGEGSLDIEGGEGSSDLNKVLSVSNLGGDASAATPSAVPTKRTSKWGNSAIKGRLSRPSDGRVPTVEQDSRERQERINKLRQGNWENVI